MGMKLVVIGGLFAAAMACQAAETWREPATGMEFVAVPKGCYRMGVPAKAFDAEVGTVFMARAQAEMPDHEVCLDSFWIGRYEIRAGEWQKIMADGKELRNPEVPVTGVTWAEAKDFARRLTEMSGGKERFRLPTEAEWEYACRAGAAPLTWIPGRDEIEGKAWFSSPYDGPKGERLKSVQAVGRKAPNGFGLHDMLGNAWEWVEDSYRPDAYGRHALYNPLVSDAQAGKRVIRGGGFRTDRHLTRCEARGWMPVEETQDTIGVRLVRTSP
jgi:formylglycine-generating enzyme required for sulfatase activity